MKLAITLVPASPNLIKLAHNIHRVTFKGFRQIRVQSSIARDVVVVEEGGQGLEGSAGDVFVEGDRVKAGDDIRVGDVFALFRGEG